jgi:hypothetical protein
MSGPNIEKAIKLMQTALQELQETKDLLVKDGDKESLFALEAKGITDICDSLKLRLESVLETAQFVDKLETLNEMLESTKEEGKKALHALEKVSGLPRKKGEDELDYVVRASTVNKAELTKMINDIEVYGKILQSEKNNKQTSNKSKKNKPH